MAILPALLLTLSAIGVGGIVIAILVAIRSEREARTTIFPIVREEEILRARHARIATFVLVAITALFSGGWLATLTVPNGEATPVAAVSPQPTAPEPGSTPLVTPITTSSTLTPTATLEPTATSTATATPTPPPPTATSTPILPTATATHVYLTPAPATARMGPIEFATSVNDKAEAINPTDTFPRNVEAVYAVFPFAGMEKGLSFMTVWYHNGVEFRRDESEWQWGAAASRSYIYVLPPGVGEYKLELRVNGSVLATGLFEIR